MSWSGSSCGTRRAVSIGVRRYRYGGHFRADSPAEVAYLNASSGEFVAVRHEAWRWWDFLWSLHIMSYSDRDTIGTWLLKCFSLLALGTAVMGVWLFAATSRLPDRQKNTRTQT